MSIKLRDFERVAIAILASVVFQIAFLSWLLIPSTRPGRIFSILSLVVVICSRKKLNYFGIRLTIAMTLMWSILSYLSLRLGNRGIILVGILSFVYTICLGIWEYKCTTATHSDEYANSKKASDATTRFPKVSTSLSSSHEKRDTVIPIERQCANCERIVSATLCAITFHGIFIALMLFNEEFTKMAYLFALIFGFGFLHLRGSKTGRSLILWGMFLYYIAAFFTCVIDLVELTILFSILHTIFAIACEAYCIKIDNAKYLSEIQDMNVGLLHDPHTVVESDTGATAPTSEELSQHHTEPPAEDAVTPEATRLPEHHAEAPNTPTCRESVANRKDTTSGTTGKSPQHKYTPLLLLLAAACITGALFITVKRKKK